MNIYLIESKHCVDYDSYDAHIVQAWTEHDARRCVPTGDEVGRMDPPTCPNFWTSDEHSSCKIVGVSLCRNGVGEAGETKPLLSSYKAG